MVYMDEESFSQQELFQQEKYISDLIEKKSEKPKSSINIMVASSLVSSAIVLSIMLYHTVLGNGKNIQKCKTDFNIFQ